MTQPADQSAQSTDSSTPPADSQATQAADQSSNDNAQTPPANSGTTDAAPEAGKTDAPPAGAVDDEGYDLELSDDSPLTDEDLDEIAEQASRLNLSKADADKLIAQKESAYKKGQEKTLSDFQSKIDAARKEIMADPIFAEGQKEQTFKSMARAVETFGDDDMVKLVQSAEFGNNVVLARFLKRLGDAMAPDDTSMTGGKGAHGPSSEDNSSLKALYPDFYK